MNARFLMKVPPGLNEKGQPHEPVEYVEISGLSSGDVTCRRATDADRSRFKTAYRTSKARPAPVVATSAASVSAPPVRARRS